MTACFSKPVALASTILMLAGVGCGASLSTATQSDATARVDHKDTTTRVQVPAPVSPSLFVRLEAVNDATKQVVTRTLRRSRVDRMRALIVRALRRSPTVTLDPDQTGRPSLRRYTVDATIEKLYRRERGKWVEIVCRLRLSVADKRGKIVALLTNGAKIRVPKKNFRREFERPLQRDVLEGATQHINRDLLTFLNKDR